MKKKIKIEGEYICRKTIRIFSRRRIAGQP